MMQRDDQSRLFRDWARRRGIEADLEFREQKMHKFVRLWAVLVGLFYLLSFIPGFLVDYRGVFLLVCSVISAVNVFFTTRVELREFRRS